MPFLFGHTMNNWMPHTHCYLDDPFVYWTSVLGDGSTGIACVWISVVIFYLTHSSKHFGGIPVARVLGKRHGFFVFLCGGVHLLLVLTQHVPVYQVEAAVKVAMAVMAIYAAITLRRDYARLRGETIDRVQQEAQRMRHAQEVLRRTNADLEQFAYSASHDLQEPLRMVGGWTSALFEDYGDRLDTDDAREMKDYIIEGVDRMRTLINDLLRFSRAGRNLRRERFSLMFALNVAISSLALRIKEEEAIIEADDLPVVYGDRGMLAQVLQNLIGNSIKYRREDVVPRIKITSEQRGDETWIHVADNGIGIETQYQKQVFEVFTRLHAREKFEGTGIGLALVRRIVHAHGGQVTLQSAGLDAGTTVSFSLPLDDSSAAPTETTTEEQGRNA